MLQRSSIKRSLMAYSFLGLLIISGFYLGSCLVNFRFWNETVAMVAAHNLPSPKLTTSIAIMWKIVGAVLLLLPDWRELGALILIIFTLLASFIFHQFWKHKAQEHIIHLVSFLSNIGLIGGLLMAAAI